MNNFFLGNNPVINEKQEVVGQFVLLDDEKFYQIKNYDSMLPFFISIASDSNHWMYISSSGGLSAGRKNPDNAIFPYYTDDKITESAEIIGSKSILHVVRNGKTQLWEPFSNRNKGIYKLERSIFKSVHGNKLLFSEKNLDLGLTFSYAWMNSDDFGWVKKSKLTNDQDDSLEVYLVDGLQNVLPSGIDQQTQNGFSTLVDGYKKTELVPDTSLALYRMEAILVDRPEPSESLRANTVWSYGLEDAHYLLSSAQLDAIRMGLKAKPETESKGVRGAYFACTNLLLPPVSSKSWYFVAELNQDATAVTNLIDFIQNSENSAEWLENSIKKGTQALSELVAQADGIQQTADENGMARHYSNVLFNIMRGGIYSDNYQISRALFNKHVQHFNKSCWAKHADFLSTLSETIDYTNLGLLIEQQNDANLMRLFQEYLPLTFSRRHGDPSRPWNMFNINIKDESGNKLLSYQGNWRDIFQNWEALSLSYPNYINGIIAKFLNASTADGYNPYRITSEGIDWEVIEPENPWSNIGYWGDHQMIYLLKLLEISWKHHPESLISWLDKKLFAYANVPYRIKKYDEIIANPKNSIRFDDTLQRQMEHLEKTYGADAKLVLNQNNEVLLVSFTEKMLAVLLAKLSNFIPEAGIWMNTQRPEWNDANNALVGTGASMVTLYYMRRFVAFTQELYQQAIQEVFTVSSEMFGFFDDVYTVLKDCHVLLENGFDDEQRRKVTDKLGIAGSHYRELIYQGSSGSEGTVSKTNLLDLFALTLDYIDQSIAVNMRSDNMYHAYNLVRFGENSITIRPLYEMLEGQVAVLSSGKLSAQEAVALLDGLRKSSLYRTDQNSYILYPNKRLPLFLEKNNIDSADVKRIKLLEELFTKGDTGIIAIDKKGEFHFNASFKNANFLHEALIKLISERTINITDTDVKEVEDLYEHIFDHQSFTGRSGTFYKYEGLGCIYWHMVSKLLLAIGENIQSAYRLSADKGMIEALKKHYFEVKAGIGAHKSPEVYGSFPFDPYSHTPTMAGVQQPGMTGQVKEDIISRFNELGVQVENGCLTFKPNLLKSEEFIRSTSEEPNLSFTYCSIPFIYKKNGRKGIEVIYTNGIVEKMKGYTLNRVQSQEVFDRNKQILLIVVSLE